MWLTTSRSDSASPVVVAQRAEHREQVVAAARRAWRRGADRRTPPAAGGRASPGPSGCRGAGAVRTRSAACTHATNASLTSSSSPGDAELGAAHEHLGGEVEGERLQRGVDPEVRPGLPRRRARRRRPAPWRRCSRQPRSGERLLHHHPVPVVLLEVEQHQPAVEERADQLAPARSVGEGLVLVLQSRPAGVRTEQDRGACRRRSRARRPGPQASYCARISPQRVADVGRSSRPRSAGPAGAEPGARSAAMTLHSTF